jgi:hypothetical protein
MLIMPTRALLVVASVVWFIAGVNVAVIGLVAGYGAWDAVLVLGAIAVFVAFLAMFLRITQKNSLRIMAIEEARVSAFRFMDLRAYIIMGFMIGMGVGLRAFNLVPDFFVTFFYTGLGAALSLAGIAYLVIFIYVSLKDQ